MEESKLHDYITGAYDRWVAYATRYIRRSRLPIDPAEVVNDVLCVLLERDSKKMEELACRSVGDKTELDLFVMHAIKMSIYSPRSPFRYARCGQRLCCQIDPNMKADDDNGDDTKIDELFAGKPFLEIEKRILAWVFVDGKRISRWPGLENKRQLYRAYHRAIKKIIAAKWKK